MNITNGAFAPTGSACLNKAPAHAEASSGASLGRGRAMDSTLLGLLARGDQVSIKQGRLTIEPISGKPVPDDWLAANSEGLIRAVLALAGIEAFYYDSYSTGRYGSHKAGGVTLQFQSVLSGESFYCIFNANLKRQRASKGKPAGTDLPPGRFSVTTRMEFYRFWQSTGLTCRRLSEFPENMGKLRAILLTGAHKNGRVTASTLRPVDIGADELARAAGVQSATRTGSVDKWSSAPPKEMTPDEWIEGYRRNKLGWQC